MRVHRSGTTLAGAALAALTLLVPLAASAGAAQAPGAGQTPPQIFGSPPAVSRSRVSR